jgi:hypothetical protein
MNLIGRAGILALIAGCFAAPSALAQGSQPVLDLSAYNIKVDYYAPRACPAAVPVPADKTEPDCIAFARYYATLQKRKMLEELGQFLAPVKWPTTLRLVMKQCPPSGGVPRPDVLYDSIEYSLIVCYDTFTYLNSISPPSSFAPKQETNVGGLVGLVLRAAARAGFDMLQVPVLGNKEDAADQLAGLVGLQFGQLVAQTVIKGTYLVWAQYNSELQRANLPYNFASASSVAPQRADTILCMAYGADQIGFKSFVDQGLLTQSRAGDCATEYRQAITAFDQTIKPHVDPAMMGKVLTMTWISPDDLK